MRVSSLIAGVVIAFALAVPAKALRQSQSPRLYVANQEDATVTVIDIETNEVAATVDLKQLGFPPNSKPHHTAVESDGSFWYVSLIAAGKVLKFDRENSLVAAADMEVPGLLALHPGRDLIIAGRSMAAVNPPSRVVLIRRSDMQILDEVDVFFPRPHALTIHPGGDYAYVGSLGVNQIASIHLDDGEVSLWDVEGPPHTFVHFAASPDGTRLVATAQLTGKLLVFDTGDAAAPAHLRNVEVGSGAWHPAFSENGRYVWFGNLDANTVTVVDASAWEVDAVLEGEGIAEPHGIAFDPDGAYVYVSNRHRGGVPEARGTVVVICRATRTIHKVLEAGRYAAGMSAPHPSDEPREPEACR
jgi:YVTN family beta-propeller protein